MSIVESGFSEIYSFEDDVLHSPNIFLNCCVYGTGITEISTLALLSCLAVLGFLIWTLEVERRMQTGSKSWHKKAADSPTSTEIGVCHICKHSRACACWPLQKSDICTVQSSKLKTHFNGVR